MWIYLQVPNIEYVGVHCIVVCCIKATTSLHRMGKKWIGLCINLIHYTAPCGLPTQPHGQKSFTTTLYDCVGFSNISIFSQRMKKIRLTVSIMLLSVYIDCFPVCVKNVFLKNHENTFYTVSELATTQFDHYWQGAVEFNTIWCRICVYCTGTNCARHT